MIETANVGGESSTKNLINLFCLKIFRPDWVNNFLVGLN